MPDRPKPIGFEIHEVLPTGDSRKTHEVSVHQGSASLMRNEFIVLVECNGHEVSQKSFKMGTDPNEVKAWTAAMLQHDHCPIEDWED